MSDSELEALKKDADRYRFLKESVYLTSYDGGWWGTFSLRGISAYDITPYAEKNGRYHDYRNSFDNAVDAEMRREKSNARP